MKVGIIGGSGLYNLKELEKVNNVQLDTPFGKPSSDFYIDDKNLNFKSNWIKYLKRLLNGKKN